jgi:hypothetical protein
MFSRRHSYKGQVREEGTSLFRRNVISVRDNARKERG